MSRIWDAMAIDYREGFRRIKIFVFWGWLVLIFMVVTNARREEYIFWVSRRVVGAYAGYRALRFIADSFAKRDPDSN